MRNQNEMWRLKNEMWEMSSEKSSMWNEKWTVRNDNETSYEKWCVTCGVWEWEIRNWDIGNEMRCEKEWAVRNEIWDENSDMQMKMRCENEKWEMRNEVWEMRCMINGKWETGNKKCENEKWEMRCGKWKMKSADCGLRNGKCEMGN